MNYLSIFKPCSRTFGCLCKYLVVDTCARLIAANWSFGLSPYQLGHVRGNWRSPIPRSSNMELTTQQFEKH